MNRAIINYYRGETIIKHETVGYADTLDAYDTASVHAPRYGADKYEVLFTCFDCMEPFTGPGIKWCDGIPAHKNCEQL
jgi:hypothetical protein